MYHSNAQGFTFDKPKKMAGSKVLALILGSLNVFLYVFAWVANLDNIKSTILFIVALIMSLVRFYYWVVRAKQNIKLKDLEIREKEFELNHQLNS